MGFFLKMILACQKTSNLSLKSLEENEGYIV